MAKKTEKKSKAPEAAPAALGRTTTTKPAAPVAKTTPASSKKPAAKAPAASKKPAVAAPAVTAPAIPAPPVSAPDATPARAAAPAAKKAPGRASSRKAPVEISTEDIQLRAYYIGEDRHRKNLPGDGHQDWLEAERQLRAELAKPKKASRKKA